MRWVWVAVGWDGIGWYSVKVFKSFSNCNTKIIGSSMSFSAKLISKLFVCRKVVEKPKCLCLLKEQFSVLLGNTFTKFTCSTERKSGCTKEISSGNRSC